jgi:hypothetical protein
VYLGGFLLEIIFDFFCVLIIGLDFFILFVNFCFELVSLLFQCFFELSVFLFQIILGSIYGFDGFL